MINYQFFPRSHGVTPQIRDIINCFKQVDETRDENVHLKSNEMLALVRPHLEALRFTVETGKAADEQIYVPVFSISTQMELDNLTFHKHQLQMWRLRARIYKNKTRLSKKLNYTNKRLQKQK